MATNIQRSSSVLTALLDSTVTADMMTRVGVAYGYTYRRGETLTNSQLAGLFLNVLRQQIKQTVLDAENTQVANTAVTNANIQVDLGSEI
jgi:hypothetical protein